MQPGSTAWFSHPDLDRSAWRLLLWTGLPSSAVVLTVGLIHQRHWFLALDLVCEAEKNKTNCSWTELWILATLHVVATKLIYHIKGEAKQFFFPYGNSKSPRSFTVRTTVGRTGLTSGPWAQVLTKPISGWNWWSSVRIPKQSNFNITWAAGGGNEPIHSSFRITAQVLFKHGNPFVC